MSSRNTAILGPLQARGYSLDEYPPLPTETGDSGRLQRAVNAVSTNGGVLIVPPGVYTFTENTGFDNGFVTPQSNVHVVGYGATFTVGAGVSQNFHFFSTNAFVQNFSIEGITFDAGNVAIVSGQYHNQAALMLNAGCNNIKVLRNVFQNWSGDQIIAIGRSSSNPSQNVWVEDNIFHNVGNSINANSTDHTSVYMSADHAYIRRNRFYNDTQSSDATAFECHGSYIWAEDNDINGYSVVGYVAAETSNTVNEICQDINIIGNIATNVYVAGRFWSSGTNTIDGVTIANNKFYLLTPPQSVVSGVGIFDIASDVAGNYVTNINIKDNLFKYTDNISGATFGTSLINLYWGNDVTIEGNTIQSASGYGISITAHAAINRLTIRKNTFHDTGLYSGFGAGIAINPNSNNITGLVIEDNEISNVAYSAMSYGIKFLAGGSLFTKTLVRRNRYNVTTFAYVMSGSGALADCYLDDYVTGTPVAHAYGNLGSKLLDVTTGRLYTAQSATDNTAWRSTERQSAIPSSGVYYIGDIVWNAAPAASGTMGWVCTTAGTAGGTAVFKTFGTISS